MLEHGFSQLANVNPEALTPEAAIFSNDCNNYCYKLERIWFA
jgi:hypothetical protein